MMGQTTFYSRQYQCWPPVANRDINDPNSYHWQNQARLAQRRLNELLGDADYETWAEMTWPGDSIDGQTWQQIFEECQFALDHPSGTSQDLECTCNPAGFGDICPVCRAYAEIRERSKSNE